MSDWSSYRSLDDIRFRGFPAHRPARTSARVLAGGDRSAVGAGDPWQLACASRLKRHGLWIFG